MNVVLRTILGVLLFGGALAYATLISLPEPLPSGIDHNALDAEAACRAAITEEVPEPRFPFAANVTYRGEARYHLKGMVDLSADREIVRRNYECVVEYTGAGSYRTDSLSLWQSH